MKIFADTLINYDRQDTAFDRDFTRKTLYY